MIAESTQPILPTAQRYALALKNACSTLGIVIATAATIIIVANQYETLKTLDPLYRITMPTLCLLFAFFTTAFSVRVGIIGCVFALPLLPTLTWQIQQYFGYGRILALHNPGFDLVAGLFLGAFTNQIRNKHSRIFSLALPWQAGLVLIILTLSAWLAISRNLHQTESLFQLSTLLYNLTHFRSIGWHDDYRPLFDLLAYGSAFALMAVMAPALKSMQNRNDVIFYPLICSLVIAAIVGYRQSTYGIGLSLDQIHFRVDRFGYMALGFQQDIHAFGGQMLIGSIGLFGYLYYTQNKLIRIVLLVGVIPLTWLALFLSKSKSNFAMSVVCLVVIAAIWIFRHSRYTTRVLLGLIAIVAFAAVSAVLFKEPWIAGITSLVQKFGIEDLAALNFKLSYRPEVYRADLHMLALFPLLGMGLSEFYRQSANYELTHSYFLSIQQNGENAHNYFLQTLVENGLLGALVFAILLFYPLWHMRNKKDLIPAWVALGAIFIGNVFAHSMLIRENLFIAAGLVSLMYAWAYAEDSLSVTVDAGSVKAPLPDPWRVKDQIPIYILTIGIGLLCAKEAYQSFKRFPFTVDTQCFKSRALDQDGWISGLYEVAIPLGSHGITLNIAGTQPDVVKRPLPAVLSIVHPEKGVVAKTELSFTKDAPTRIELNLPGGVMTTDSKYHAELRLQRCFIPKNMGINADDRRLGIRIQSSTTQ
jgi:hypothetical protein